MIIHKKQEAFLEIDKINAKNNMPYTEKAHKEKIIKNSLKEKELDIDDFCDGILNSEICLPEQEQQLQIENKNAGKKI